MLWGVGLLGGEEFGEADGACDEARVLRHGDVVAAIAAEDAADLGGAEGNATLVSVVKMHNDLVRNVGVDAALGVGAGPAAVSARVVEG
jgi:hypothetical protein